MGVSYLAPVEASGYDAVGMEYADAAEFNEYNAIEGPPWLTAVCDAGSTITFDTSEFVRGAKSVKCLMTGAADATRKSIYKGGYTTLDVGAHSIGITMRSRDDDSVLHYHRLRQRAGGRR